MSAEVEKQNVQLVPQMELAQAFRAVCYDHPQTEPLIAPWLGEVYVIEPGQASWFNAALDAKAHNIAEHGAVR